MLRRLNPTIEVHSKGPAVSWKFQSTSSKSDVFFNKKGVAIFRIMPKGEIVPLFPTIVGFQFLAVWGKVFENKLESITYR